MNAQTRQYLFGAIFFSVGMYQLYLRDFLEFALYAVAGVAFSMNALASEPSLAAFKRPLVIATWIFISATAILLLYLLQFKFL